MVFDDRETAGDRNLIPTPRAGIVDLAREIVGMGGDGVDMVGQRAQTRFEPIAAFRQPGQRLLDPLRVRFEGHKPSLFFGR